MEIDPICGMKVDEKIAKKKGLIVKGNYFCSQNCKDRFQNKVKWYKSEKFGRYFPYVLGIVLVLGTVLSVVFDFMLFYMGVFFIIFSLFKMPDWRGFVNAFSSYDIIAGKLKTYAWIYPVLEFVLGILFILNYYSEFFLSIIAVVTLIVMGIGSIGVGLKILKKENFQCACLGTWINVPLTSVTLLEDLLMVFMALILLI